MAKGRELKSRIKSVENTRKITRTMEMVATSKMKRAHDRVSAARPYAQALRDVIASLYSPELRSSSIAAPAGEGQARRSCSCQPRLAGAFNANLIKERARRSRGRAEGVKVDIHAVGRRASAISVTSAAKSRQPDGHRRLTAERR
jgi:F-type H+-transporting ATPase subunit gamma